MRYLIKTGFIVNYLIDIKMYIFLKCYNVLQFCYFRIHLLVWRNISIFWVAVSLDGQTVWKQYFNVLWRTIQSKNDNFKITNCVTYLMQKSRLSKIIRTFHNFILGSDFSVLLVLSYYVLLNILIIINHFRTKTSFFCTLTWCVYH